MTTTLGHLSLYSSQLSTVCMINDVLFFPLFLLRCTYSICVAMFCILRPSVKHHNPILSIVSLTFLFLSLSYSLHLVFIPICYYVDITQCSTANLMCVCVCVCEHCLLVVGGAASVLCTHRSLFVVCAPFLVCMAICFDSATSQLRLLFLS